MSTKLRERIEDQDQGTGMNIIELACGHRITLEDYLNNHRHDIGVSPFAYVLCPRCRRDHCHVKLLDDDPVAAGDVINPNSKGGRLL